MASSNMVFNYMVSTNMVSTNVTSTNVFSINVVYTNVVSINVVSTNMVSTDVVSTYVVFNKLFSTNRDFTILIFHFSFKENSCFNLRKFCKKTLLPTPKIVECELKEFVVTLCNLTLKSFN